VPFGAVLAPITIATSAIGVYALVATLLWGRLLFGIPLHVEHPALFVLSLAAAIVATECSACCSRRR
jgi:ABC-2 type transport system permease protein